MRAIILSAGKGERLKHITNVLPKPMVQFKEKPILQHNIEMCKNWGIRDIFINVHHLAEKITGYFGDGSKYGVSIKYSHEEELLGTSGAVKKIANSLWNNESGDFVVIYGDNFSQFDLQPLILLKNNVDTYGVIGFHYREDVSSSGVAEFDDDSRIKSFIEKPAEGVTNSHWVNAGIYLLDKKILGIIPEGFSDFAKDIFPYLLKNNLPIHGVPQDVELKAFDTPEMLQKALGE